MKALEIVSLVSLIGWLVLIATNPKIRELGLSRGALMAFVWIAIFVIVAIVTGRIA